MSEKINTSEQSPSLDPAQLAILVRYVAGSVDSISGESYDYSRAIRDVTTLSSEMGNNVDVGYIAITAARVGALTRNPADFDSSGIGLITSMVHENDLTGDQAGVFRDMQNRFTWEHTAINVSNVLGAGLEYLKGREFTDGEDISRAKIAFLASAYAATEDMNLRQSIHNRIELKTFATFQ
jgi:energy-converting hydrogenase Eha subunit A